MSWSGWFRCFWSESAIDSESSVHHLDPPSILLAQFRINLKYKCSMMRNTMDRHTPHPSSMKADMNWARARGLLEDFFLSPGLHAPVNQNLISEKVNTEKSPDWKYPLNCKLDIKWWTSFFQYLLSLTCAISPSPHFLCTSWASHWTGADIWIVWGMPLHTQSWHTNYPLSTCYTHHLDPLE